MSHVIVNVGRGRFLSNDSKGAVEFWLTAAYGNAIGPGYRQVLFDVVSQIGND